MDTDTEGDRKQPWAHDEDINLEFDSSASTATSTIGGVKFGAETKPADDDDTHVDQWIDSEDSGTDEIEPNVKTYKYRHRPEFTEVQINAADVMQTDTDMTEEFYDSEEDELPELMPRSSFTPLDALDVANPMYSPGGSRSDSIATTPGSARHRASRARSVAPTIPAMHTPRIELGNLMLQEPTPAQQAAGVEPPYNLNKDITGAEEWEVQDEDDSDSEHLSPYVPEMEMDSSPRFPASMAMAQTTLASLMMLEEDESETECFYDTDEFSDSQTDD